ncbi:MAG: DUF4328 domain-containing protein [Bacteroidetes bacterium]|nr:DUF4328 domain-containing protein [Bacteroidota bacterium]
MRSIQGFARFATIALYANLLFIAIELITDVRLISLGSTAFIIRNILLGSIGSALIPRISTAVQLICIVAFLLWFFHAYRNLQDTGVPDLNYSPAWAEAGFFVPFLNPVSSGPACCRWSLRR